MNNAEAKKILDNADYLPWALVADAKEKLMIEEPDNKLRDAAERALRFMADLNGCNWIAGNDPASVDMKQRAKALQVTLFSALYLNEGSKS